MKRVTLEEIERKMSELYKKSEFRRNVMIDYDMMNDTQKRLFDKILAEEATNFIVSEKNIKKS